MAQLSPDSRAPAMNVMTWFLMATAILSVFTRLGTKYWACRKFTRDDYFSILSLIICAAQSIAVSLATANGYGEHYESLSRSQIENVMKSQYSANILFIVSLYFSKLASISFIENLTPTTTTDHSVAMGLKISTLVWTVVGVIVLVFQCKLPRTWDYLSGQCLNVNAWWDYLGVTNILLESGMILQAMLVIARIQTHTKRKILLVVVFLFRIAVIASILCQVIAISKWSASPDLTYESWVVVISTQLVQSLSIMTACSPQFRPFLDGLRSTGVRLDEITTHSRSQKGYGSSSASRARSRKLEGTDRDDAHELVTVPIHQTTVTTSAPSANWDAESQCSDTHIIREIRTWTVTEARRPVQFR
ncbi:hypothetical protein BDV28DRAFT_48871 [Aspergillus coremiiformis]|uniref:Rhodopsin domain-containing protein n=1 Tax=Aspergillus coremiiformis TaxID=138285 RepID=A0A5N6ZCH7_9EURO|nr:hypothetical protein BDV28DRAFT_48871 [Aspergillus coremiiformis]